MNLDVMAYAAWRYAQLWHNALVAFVWWKLTRIELLRRVALGWAIMLAHWVRVVQATGLGVR